MKTRLIIALLAFGFNLGILSQDGKIKINIANAIENKGVEYFSDGSVKSVINIDKVKFYYQWIKTADTLSVIDHFTNGGISNLMSDLDTYRNEKLDYDDQINKCQLISKRLRDINSQSNSENLQIAHLLKR